MLFREPKVEERPREFGDLVKGAQDARELADIIEDSPDMYEDSDLLVGDKKTEVVSIIRSSFGVLTEEKIREYISKSNQIPEAGNIRTKYLEFLNSKLQKLHN